MRCRIFLGACAAIVFFAACSPGPPTGRVEQPRPGLEIAASVYPLGFLAGRVAGQTGRVVELTKAGAEPHDVELTAGQAGAISRADLVVYLGGGFQPSIEAAMEGIGTRALNVLPAALGEAAEGAHDEEGHGEDSGSHPAGEHDPHVWQDPVRAQAIVRALSGRLAQINPGGAAGYAERAGRLNTQLRQLHRRFVDGLAHCSGRTIITAHGSFGYLAERYGLEQAPIGGRSPEAEPTPRRMARLATLIRKEALTTVFYERLVSPEAAQTLAAESGARTDLLDPLESRPTSGNYFTAMNRNLGSLKKALGCSR